MKIKSAQDLSEQRDTALAARMLGELIQCIAPRPIEAVCCIAAAILAKTRHNARWLW